MKITVKTRLLILLVALSSQVGGAQGFVNLDFEDANVAGYSPGSMIPTADAFPGWSVGASTAGYDLIPLGSFAISIIDSNAPAFVLQGNYSAFLFGANGIAAEISQTGLVPNGTESLQMDVYSFYNFIVTLGGQTLNMIPLSTNSTSIVYGADISAFAGQNATLSLIAPPVANPNGVEFDSIVFSSQSVPEPSEFGLFALGGLFFRLGRRQHFAR